ncbi:MAG: FtsQ-type POTRA domain-containing protein [Clostridia bacterium]|nr:FtsQ-type POTRA domain-containing protein [Clostridia bacterium]
MTQPLPPDFVPWEAEEIAPPPRRKLKPGIKTALLCLVVLAVLAVFVFGSLFRIRTVTIYGNERFTPEEVMQQAGISYGISYFTVTDEYLRDHIGQNHYFIYNGMEKRVPGILNIYITERKERANVYVMGINYLLDEEGMVLRKNTDGLQEDLPAVTGMQTRSVTEGKMIIPGNENQLKSYQAIMTELLAQGYAGEIAELKVSDPEKLYLLTRSGYTIELGDGENLRAKIGTARAVVEKLEAMGYEGGVIDASVPAIATYTPADL